MERVPREECPMRHLPELPSLTPALIAALLIGDQRRCDPKAELHRRIFVRLIHKAIDEYNETRQSFIVETVDGFDFMNHLENCLNATSRLLSVVDRLKRNANATLFDKDLRRCLSAYKTPVMDLRDVIEHKRFKIMNLDQTTRDAVSHAA